MKLARPRTRAELIDDPEYVRLRAHVLRFLVEGGRRPLPAAEEIAAAAGYAPGLRRSAAR